MSIGIEDIKGDPAFGSFAAVARLCGVSREAVRHWDEIPALYCVRIESATNGRVTRYELRSDVFGPAPAAPEERAA